MIDKFLNELSFTEFDQLIQRYINRAESDALTLDIFQAVVDESNQPPLQPGAPEIIIEIIAKIITAPTNEQAS